MAAMNIKIVKSTFHRKLFFTLPLFLLLGLTSVTSADTHRQLTAASLEFRATLDSDERAWLKNRHGLIVSGPRAFPPFYFFDNGQVQGMSVDYL